MNPEQARLINDIEAELEKPDTKPVAWLTIDSRNNHHVHLVKMTEKTTSDWNIKQQLPLYTHPPSQQKPLTIEQIDELRCRYSNIIIGHPVDFEDIIDFTKLIEKAHGIE